MRGQDETRNKGNHRNNNRCSYTNSINNLWTSIMIPCKKDKCLLYPSCMNKHNIKCIWMIEYYDSLRHQYSRSRSWQLIRIQLPNILSMVVNDGVLSYNVFDAFNPRKTDEHGLPML